MLGFLANIGENFRNHYLRMTDDMLGNRTPQHFHRSTPLQNLNQLSPTPATPVDRWEPSSKVTPETGSEQTVQQNPTNDVPADTNTPINTPSVEEIPVTPETEVTDEFVPSGETPSEDISKSPENNPDGTYSLIRASHLDYKLDLRFDLAAISQTVRYLAGGDTTGVEQMEAAGFGLSADFALKGFQITQSQFPEGDDPTNRNLQTHGLTRTASRQAGLFQANSRDFALQSFFRESTKQQQSYNVMVRNGHQRAVNRFAFRFKFDSQFSFSHLQRFNVQTNNMANQMPESLGKYLNAAGEVAQSGSNNMMATFFDAVDAYLNQAEDQLLGKTVAAFEQAADELGFSGSMVEMAKNHLTGSIESFFNRVDAALGEMRTQFVPEAPTSPEIPVEEPILQPENMVDNITQPVEA